MVRLNARRIYWIILFCSGVFSSILFTLDMVYFVKIVELDPLQLVLVGTTLETSVLLFEVPTGVVADVYNRRLSVIVGTVLMGIGFVLEGLVPAFGVILAAQVVWGFGWTFISGARSAWIPDEVGQEQAGAVFLRGTQATQLGSLLGIPVSVLLGRVALNLPLLVGGGLYVLLGLFLVFFYARDRLFAGAPGGAAKLVGLAAYVARGLEPCEKKCAVVEFVAHFSFFGAFQ